MAFFGHFEKLKHDKLKTQTIYHENIRKISEKLEHRRLSLTFYNTKKWVSIPKNQNFKYVVICKIEVVKTVIPVTRYHKTWRRL